MADRKNKTGASPLGFLKKTLGTTTRNTTQKETTRTEETVTSLSAIADMLVTVLEEKLPVRLFLGRSSLVYYTHLEWELVENKEGEVHESAHHLRQGEYLLLAALDPPIGNIKVRSATEISMEFFTRFHLLHCPITLQHITGTKKLCFSFPKELQRKPQSRSSFRAPVSRTMDIALTVVRPSGIRFDAKFDDVATGGAAFFPIGTTPRIADHSRLELNITYPDDTIAVDAVVLGSFVRDGEHFFRTQFLIDSHNTANAINTLVAYVQRGISRNRLNTFS